MILAYTKKLGFRVEKTNVGTYDINSKALAIYSIAITNFFLRQV